MALSARAKKLVAEITNGNVKLAKRRKKTPWGPGCRAKC